VMQIQDFTPPAAEEEDDPLDGYPSTNDVVFAYMAQTNGCDDSGNAHYTEYGTAPADPTYQSETNGVEFDGNDWIQCGTNTALLNGASEATIMCWAKRDTVGWRYLLEPSGNVTEFGIRVGTSGIQAFVNGTASGYATMNTGQWYHIALVWDSSASSRGKLYVDGVLSQSISAAAGTLAIATVWVEGTSAKSNFFWDGLIDDVVMYDVGLISNDCYTASQVEVH